MRVALIVVTLVIFGLSGWWHYGIWNECRDADFSISYCLRMITR